MQSMMLFFFISSTSPFCQALYMSTGISFMGQASMHLPQRRQWGSSTKWWLFLPSTVTALTPLMVGTLRSYWATPIMGPPERTL